MLRGLRSTYRSLVSDECGFTLTEMLVALAAGSVVMLALFSVLDVSLTHSTALENRVQANQIGRIAMTRIVDELHSACLSPGFTPVQEKSTNTELVFRSSYGGEAVLGQAYEHKIVFDSKKGTLTDNMYKSNGGSWPTFTFPSTPTSTTLLASNVSETGSEEVFRYYSYGPASESSETNPLSSLTPLKVPLSTESAAQAASVQITFSTATAYRVTKLNPAVNLTAQVTFAFSVPNAETPIHDSPCQ